MIKKIILGAFVIILLALLTYANTGINMPPESDQIVKDVLTQELPELVTGETAFAKSGDLNIWYEVIEPRDTAVGTVLLVMGLSSTAILWTKEFYSPFVDAGYRVIRYDNRDVGMSTWVENWDENTPYTLEDMALDGIAVLDHADITTAHVIGASMGGMIAQRMAISYPERVSSLTSIMSSGYMSDPDITPVSKHFESAFIKLGLKYLLTGSESGMVKFFLGTQQELKGDGPYEMNAKGGAQIMLYEVRNRNGFNSSAVEQHGAAIEASGSRLEELGEITAPTLIIHGKSDPLVIIDHAYKYAPLIPQAETLYIDGMGHDIPLIYMQNIQNAILKNMLK